ncbi:MAG: undecaprenyl-diphosphatase UppP [Desulfobulbaceae bacterium]|nr:undecaprenyl-diphosphatase UppP [Desulfobulbaceae bacterium]
MIKAFILGIVQGLTEFLPISSSGHLVIGSALLGFQEPGIAFEVFLHCGTLLAVIFVFRADLLIMVSSLFVSAAVRRADPHLNRLFYWNFYIILATLPIVFFGLWLKDSIDQIFANILITFVMLAITGILMVLTRYIHEKGAPVTWSRSLIIGIAQAIAIMPGMSRSGSTIFAGMVMGVNRETAARFSFIMAIPAILGAVVLKLSDLIMDPPSSGMILSIAVGTMASVISGYYAIVLLMHLVRRGSLEWFGYYCLCVSGIGLTWYFLQ